MKAKTVSDRISAIARPDQQKEVVAKLIAALKEHDDTDCYWTLKDIARYTGVSTHTVRRVFLSDPRWPTPIATSNARTASKRWLASEVKKALLLFKMR